MKWLLASLIVLGFVSHGLASPDEARVKSGIDRLNELIQQNQWNDQNGFHHLNRYVFFLDEKHIFEFNGTFLKPGATTINEIEQNLRDLSSAHGIDLYVALSAEAFTAAQKNQSEKLPSQSALLTNMKNILLNILNGSEAKNKLNGKYALLGITPVVKIQVGDGKKDDKLSLWYLRQIAEGPAFPLLAEIIRGKYGSNRTQLGQYSKNPDEAVKSHTSLYANVLQRYDEESKEINPLSLKGFAFDYFQTERIKATSPEQREYLEKLCLLLDKMGISLTREYLEESQKEKVAYFARQLVKGQYTKPIEATYKGLYEELKPKYDGFLHLITQLEITKNGDRAVAVIGSFNSAEMESLTLDQRCNALRYLHTTDLDGGFIFKSGEEYVIDLIASTPSDQVVDFLNFLEKEQVTHVYYTGKEYSRREETTSVIYALLKNFDDYGFNENSNYQKLILAFKGLIVKSDRAFTKYANIGESFSHRIFLWKDTPLLSANCSELSVKDSKYSFSQEKNGQILVGSEILKRKYFYTYYNAANNSQGTGVGCDWETIPAYRINPFDLVAFVNVNENSIVQPGSTDYIVPAIFLEFIADREFKEDALSIASLVVDAALIATGPGSILTAVRAARWGVAAWELANVAGAIGNVYALSSSDQQVQDIVNKYNLLMLGFGLTKGVLSNTDIFDVAAISKKSGNNQTYAQQIKAQEFSDALNSEKATAALATLLKESDHITITHFRKLDDYLVSKGIVKRLAKGGAKTFDASKFQQWIGNISTRNASGAAGSAPRVYQERVAGLLEYEIKGGDNVKIWADGVDQATGKVIEAKYISNPGASPFVEGSSCYPPVRQKIVEQVTDEFDRYSKIIKDRQTPLTELEVTISDIQAKPFFEKLLKDFDIPGRVVVKP
jgi:hypothetical protein